MTLWFVPFPPFPSTSEDLIKMFILILVIIIINGKKLIVQRLDFTHQYYPHNVYHSNLLNLISGLVGETVEWVKGLLCNHEHLVWMPSIHTKDRCSSACTIPLELGDRVQVYLQRSLLSWFGWNRSMGDPISNKRFKVLKGDTWCWPLSLLCMLICVCMHMNAYLHICTYSTHTHKYIQLKVNKVFETNICLFII